MTAWADLLGRDSRPDRDQQDPAALRTALALVATGVTVIATANDDHPHAMTAGSLTQVSIVPPLILICLRPNATAYQFISKARTFTASVLAADQEHLARHFADPRRAPGWAQFSDVNWRPAPSSHAPLFDGCLAWFDCVLHSASRAGDHDILISRVVWAEITTQRNPLVRFARSYRRLDPIKHDGPDRKRNGHDPAE